MNAHAFKGERHRKVPEIVTLGEYDIGAYAKPKPKTQQGKIKASSDGSLKISLPFSTKSQAYRWLDSDKPEADLERSLTEDERQDIRQAIADSKFQKINVGPQKLPLNHLNLRQQYRSAAHTLLKCLGFYRPDWVCNDITREVREFARDGKGSWQKFAIMVKQHASCADNAAYKLGVRYNAAEIYWCHSLEKVIGVVTLLGRVKRAVILAEDYPGPDAILSVIEDTYGSSKQPQSWFTEFNSAMPAVSLVEILYSPPPIEFFKQEFFRLAASSPFEGLTASLLNDIKKITEQTPEITEATLQKYENLFLEYALNLEMAYGISVKSAEVSSKLAEHGFSDLARHHVGKSCKDDSKICSILGTALDGTLKYLMLKMKT